MAIGSGPLPQPPPRGAGDLSSPPQQPSRKNSSPGYDQGFPGRLCTQRALPTALTRPASPSSPTACATCQLLPKVAQPRGVPVSAQTPEAKTSSPRRVGCVTVTQGHPCPLEVPVTQRGSSSGAAWDRTRRACASPQPPALLPEAGVMLAAHCTCAGGRACGTGSHCGKQPGGPSTRQRYHYDPAIPLLGVCPRRTENMATQKPVHKCSSNTTYHNQKVQTTKMPKR